MAENNITSANSVFTLQVPGLFSEFQQLQGYAADRAFETAAVDIAETVLGVDGRLSAGWVPYTVDMTVTIMPDSPSNELFDQWAATEKRTRSKLRASANILLPAIGRQYALRGGFFVSYPPLPSAQRVLQARAFTLRWEDIAWSRR